MRLQTMISQCSGKNSHTKRELLSLIGCLPTCVQCYQARQVLPPTHDCPLDQSACTASSGAIECGLPFRSEVVGVFPAGMERLRPLMQYRL